MPAPAVWGAAFGLGLQFYINAVRKLPLLRNPWQHAVAMGAGAAFGSWLVEFEAQQERELAGAALSDYIDVHFVCRESQFVRHLHPLSPAHVAEMLQKRASANSRSSL
jgi:hypothetical protein